MLADSRRLCKHESHLRVAFLFIFGYEKINPVFIDAVHHRCISSTERNV